MSSSPNRPTTVSKVALVTDAISARGRLISGALATQGWDLALHYQPATSAIDAKDATTAQASAQTLVKEYESLGRRACAIPADLDNEIAATALIPQAIAALGSLSCVINNAAIVEQDSAADFSAAQLEQHMRRNLSAPLLLTKALHAATPEGKQAVVINLLDQKLFSPEPDFLSYTLSKAALQSATQMLALAYAPKLRIVGVATLRELDSDPTETGRSPLPASTSAEDLAASICFIAGATAITGTTLLMDSGQHLRARSGNAIAPAADLAAIRAAEPL
ncbi:SDR family NAD(P)-dependent oxidoreductase [Glaciimonas sp. PCH181]|uniref:SDR family NAD(P)-dependent oxidoreductase n=1 Tax=Glaciimonas sp. PCH181 TaxID=2133943 RepID=UPI000D3B8841|nr:SDR family NAD(P)-dependent oxidoreductase [Glaciimonas sp. PCH181]PUA17635.1 short-chain dehydrogenase [Glaciimonas sp. PCH181]